MFFAFVVLVIWLPVGVTLFLGKNGGFWGADKPSREVAPTGCAGIVVGAPILMMFGVLTERYPLCIVPAFFGSMLFFYSAGLVSERIAIKLGLLNRPKGAPKPK